MEKLLETLVKLEEDAKFVERWRPLIKALVEVQKVARINGLYVKSIDVIPQCFPLELDEEYPDKLVGIDLNPS